MKKLLLAAGLLASVCTAQAQNNISKLNAASLAARTLSAFWEHQTAPGRSRNLGLLLSDYRTLDVQSGFNGADVITHEVRYRGVGLTGEFRFRSPAKGLCGLFWGPYVRLQHFSVRESTTYNSNAPVARQGRRTAVSGGLVGGWQGLIRHCVSIEPFLGVGLAIGIVTDNRLTLHSTSAGYGLELRPGLSIGYSFGKAAE